MTSHMDQAGEHDPAWIEQRKMLAREAELWYVERCGGFLTAPLDPRGDVLRPDGRIIDIKTVLPGWQFVNGGAKDPVSVCVVILIQPTSPVRFRIMGHVDVGRWHFGRPRADWFDCWYVARPEIRGGDAPEDERSAARADGAPGDGDPGDIQMTAPPALGSVDPRSFERSREDQRRQQWREAGQRRRQRVSQLPVALPWTDPDTAHRGLGSSGGGRPAKRTGEEMA